MSLDPRSYPEGSYTTVRGLSNDWWSAIVAHDGNVLAVAQFSERSHAFRSARRMADVFGIDCLVEVAE